MLLLSPQSCMFHSHEGVEARGKRQPGSQTVMGDDRPVTWTLGMQ